MVSILDLDGSIIVDVNSLDVFTSSLFTMCNAKSLCENTMEFDNFSGGNYGTK